MLSAQMVVSVTINAGIQSVDVRISKNENQTCWLGAQVGRSPGELYDSVNEVPALALASLSGMGSPQHRKLPSKK
jgi:hypothetical protein